MKSVKEWQEFIVYASKCPNHKNVRGGGTCVIDGITAYCDPYSCPRLKE